MKLIFAAFASWYSWKLTAVALGKSSCGRRGILQKVTVKLLLETNN